jgi:hypothetical protein
MIPHLILGWHSSDGRAGSILEERYLFLVLSVPLSSPNSSKGIMSQSLLRDCEHQTHYQLICSLQEALYEFALEYYGNHTKRIRRKRNRPPPSSQTPAHSGAVRPLRPVGWTTRYDYKMATFAELRGEEDVALKFVCPFAV